MSEHLLSVKDLRTSFTTDNGEVHAVNGVSFNLDTGKVLGIVGESGSGKSVTAYSIMQILADNGRITGGSVEYKGQDITKWNRRQMAGFRGKCCSIIFQDPMTTSWKRPSVCTRTKRAPRPRPAPSRCSPWWA